MSNIDPKTSSEAVIRSNGRTAEEEFSMVPEILLGVTSLIKGETHTIAKPYTDFRYIYLEYSGAGASLACSKTMIVATRFLAPRINDINLNNTVSIGNEVCAQIGFTDSKTLTVGYFGSTGIYTSMYLKVSGIK